MKALCGKARVFGDNISTDRHLSAKYRRPGISLEELVTLMFEEIRPGFSREITPGDWLVAGRNFGRASSREDAVKVLRLAGIRGVIAESVDRLFYRNAINLGLYVLTAPTAGIEEGDDLEMRPDLGEILVHGKRGHLVLRTEPYPPFLSRLVRDGGLVGHLRINGRFEI